jgi:MFS family permease
VSPVSALVHSRTFSSLHERNFRLYFTGQAISLTGTWAQNVAQAWLMVQLTHSAVALGWLTVCQFGPFALLGPVGGALSDRLDQRRVLIGTQAAAMAIAALLAALALAGAVSVPVLLVLAGLSGVVQVIDVPARQSFTMRMVGRGQIPNAVALNASTYNACRTAGPAIGGVLLATVGAAPCFGLNALSYLPLLLCLRRMRTADLHTLGRERGLSVLRSTREGIGFVSRHRAIRTILMTMFASALIGTSLNVLLASLTERTFHGGPVLFGILWSCFGFGALAGALGFASAARADQRVLVWGACGFGVAQLMLGLASSPLSAGLLLVVCGASFAVYASSNQTLLQLIAPDRMRGRVLSLYSLVYAGMAPLGGLLAGVISDRAGASAAFVVGGLITLCSVAAAARVSRAFLWLPASQAEHAAPA